MRSRDVDVTCDHTNGSWDVRSYKLELGDRDVRSYKWEFWEIRFARNDRGEQVSLYLFMFASFTKTDSLVHMHCAGKLIKVVDSRFGV